MNVHRRDRARLKQSEDQYLFSKSSSPPEYPSHNYSDDIRETSSYTLVFNSNPNRFESQHSCVIDLSSSPSPLPFLTPRVSSASPSFVVEPSNNSKKIISSFPWSCPGKKGCDLYEVPFMEGSRKRKIDRDEPKNGDKVNVNLENTNDLSVRMNLVIHKDCPNNAQGGDEEIGKGDMIHKRRRMRESSSQPSIFISSLSCKCAIITRNEELKHKGGHFEDLDLELRLGGDPRKAN